MVKYRIGEENRMNGKKALFINQSFLLALFLLFVPVFSFAQGDGAGKRYAVCIGVDDYADPSIVKLSTARNDAADLGSRLVSAGWDKVFVLTDNVDYRNQDFPNRTNIENRIALLADLVKSEDTIFVFFSGHGVSDSSGSSVLPVDASLSRLKDTCIPVSSIVGAFTSRGITRVILAIDACREQVSTTKGIAVTGVTGGSGANAAALALFATKSGWYSYEDAGGRNGVFTRFVLSGLSGDADGCGTSGVRDGNVTFSELASWLPDATGSYALDKGIRQQAVSVRGSGDSAALDVAIAPVGAVAPASASVTPVVASSTSAAEDAASLGPLIGEIGKRVSSIVGKSLSEAGKSVDAAAAKEDARAQARAAKEEKAAQARAAKQEAAAQKKAEALQKAEEEKQAAAEKASVARATSGGSSSDEAKPASDSEKHGLGLIQLGLFNPAQLVPARSSVLLVSVGAIQTRNYHNFGVQVAPITATELMGGVQVGVLSFTDSVVGVQVGGILSRSKSVYGGQVGFINTADEVYGIQCGFINVAKRLHGMQIGGINVLERPGMFGRFMVGVNIGF
jgi:uncharacterized caspase-like protein